MRCHCKTIFITLLFLTACYADKPAVLDKAQAINDLDYLIQKIIELHPDPFKRMPEQQFWSRLRQIKSDLGEQISRKDFSLIVAELLALLRDSHTTLLIHEQPDFAAFCQSGGKIFPLRLRYSKACMSVASWAGDIKQKRLKKADTVVAVNHKPMSALLERYRGYISAETELQQYWLLEQYFPILHWLVEGPCQRYELTIQTAKGETFKESLSPAEWNVYELLNISDPYELFAFRFHKQDRICLFKAQTFSKQLYDKFIKKLDDLVSQMKQKGTAILVVDLRGNGGGSAALGWQILKKTISKPAHTGSKYTKDLYKLLSTPTMKNIRTKWWLPDHEVILPTPDSWKGTLVLLCDHRTGSAAVSTAAIVKDNQAGIIAGEETGGRASYFGEVVTLTLPASRLPCFVSTAYFPRPAKFDDGRGVLPDLPLDVTQEDKVLLERIHEYVEDANR